VVKTIIMSHERTGSPSKVFLKITFDSMRIKLFEEYLNEGEDIISKIKTDMESFKVDGQRPQGDLSVGKDSVSVSFKHVGNWVHDEERHSEEETEDEDWREDDDQMIWAHGEYKKYMAQFDEWAKGKSWYSKVKLGIDTGEKNWTEFSVTIKK